MKNGRIGYCILKDSRKFAADNVIRYKWQAVYCCNNMCIHRCQNQSNAINTIPLSKMGDIWGMRAEWQRCVPGYVN